MRIIALQRIALRIKPNRTYTEKEANSIIKDNALFYHQRYDKKIVFVLEVIKAFLSTLPFYTEKLIYKNFKQSDEFENRLKLGRWP